MNQKNTEEKALWDITSIYEMGTLAWKMKWQMVLVIIGSVIAFLAIAFLSKEVYNVKVAIEPGVIGVDTYDRIMFNDTAINLGTKIKNGAYTGSIYKKLKINPKEEMIDFKTKYSRSYNSVIVSLATKDVKLGQEILRCLADTMRAEKEPYIKSLLANIDKKIERKENDIKELERQEEDLEKEIQLSNNEISQIGVKRSNIEKDINVKQTEIAKLQAEIKRNEERKSINKKRLLELDEQIRSVKTNSEAILKERDTLLKDTSQMKSDPLSILLYSNVIQQNFQYYNDLLDQRKEVEETIETINRDIALSEQDILLKKEEIAKLVLEKDGTLVHQIGYKKINIEQLVLKRDVMIPSLIEDANDEIDQLRLEKERIFPLKLIDEPSVSPFPIFPKKKLMVVFGFLVGIILGVVILVVAYTMQSLKKPVSS